MTNKDTINIFLVDDDAVFLKLLEIEFLQETKFIVKTFATGEQCLEHLPEGPDVIILDYFLNGVNKAAIDGIKTLDRIQQFNPKIPVIMLSSQDKIDVAVECMHRGAFDYVVKSETAFIRLNKIISNILRERKLERELNWLLERV